MKDRVSRYPGRFSFTRVDTGETFLVDVERADDPIEEGTAINKQNLLTDDTEEAFGAETVNDALWKLRNSAQVVSSGDSVTATDIFGNTIGGFVRVAQGSYAGVNEYNTPSSRSLTLPFPPKLVVITGGPEAYISARYTLIMVAGGRKTNALVAGDVDEYVEYSVSGNTITWTNQLSSTGGGNYKNITYHWVAFG